MPDQMISLLEAKGIQANALAKDLEENFPPLNPHPSQTIGQVMYMAGQRSVVEWILKRLEDNDS
jgi:hypothetical protein|tara:strand:+ start:1223 stop:1414 length:192 start_codon:yes stop_codon:yes gene_type:complete